MSIDFIDGKKLAARISEIKEELAQLLHLETFLGKKPAKRGRKPGKNLPPHSVSDIPATGAKKSKAKGKRGAQGEKILKFLSTKGKDGATVTDIAAAIKTKYQNVYAWTLTTGKSKIKKVAPATFALKD